MSAPDLAPYRSVTANVLDDVAGYDVGFLTLSPQPADAHRVLVTWVTGNYFPLLDVKPALGRLFVADDVVAGRISPIVVLGYSTWQKRFGGDRSVIGRHVMINGRSCTIVGVAPQAFRGTFAFTDSELYLPLTWAQGWPKLASQHALARLRAGATIGQAQASIDIVAQRLAKDDPDNYSDARITVIPERLARPEEEEARWNTLASTITFGLVALVLAIAAVNVTNLLLARGGDRRRELAIRAALGASRGRLVRQLLTEALLLAAVGGIAGTVIARWTGMALSNIRLPGDKPIHLDFHLDIRVLVYAAAVALITGLVVGLWPAFHSSRPDVNRVLRDGGRRSASGSSARGRARGILIVAQIAGCFVLLVAAGLFTRSLSEAERINLGFRAAGVLNVGMDVQQLAYDEQRGRDFFDQLERRVRDLPAVNDVAFAANVPLGYIRMSEFIDVEGQPRATGQRPLSGVNWVSPSYFKTMGIRIVDGRSLEVEEARPVAVVNQRFADVAWPGERAIGRRFSTRGPDGPWIEVIGVTETGKYRFRLRGSSAVRLLSTRAMGDRRRASDAACPDLAPTRAADSHRRTRYQGSRARAGALRRDEHGAGARRRVRILPGADGGDVRRHPGPSGRFAGGRRPVRRCLLRRWSAHARNRRSNGARCGAARHCSNGAWKWGSTSSHPGSWSDSVSRCW